MGIYSHIKPLRERLPDLWWYTMLMFFFSRIGDVIQFFIGLFIVPEYISQNELGAIPPLTSLISFAALPLSFFTITAAKYINVFMTRGEQGKIKNLMHDLFFLNAALSVGVVFFIWYSRDKIQSALHFDTPVLVAIIALTSIITCWTPLMDSINMGMKNFKSLIWVKIIGPTVRLLVILITISSLGLTGYFSAMFCAQVAIFFFLVYSLLPFFSRVIPRQSYREHGREMFFYCVPAALTMLALSSQAFLEPCIIRNYLSKVDSAGYFIAALFGVIPLWVAPAITTFLFPLASQEHEKRKSTLHLHVQSLIFVLLVGLSITLIFYFSGTYILSLRPAWVIYSSFGPFIWKISLLTSFKCTVISHIAHENACRNFRYQWFLFPILGLEFFIFSLMIHGNAGVSSHLTLDTIILIMAGSYGALALGAVIQIVLRCKIFPMK